MRKLDIDALDPGIRRLVVWCRDRQFETTDSGDGAAKIASGRDPDALPIPHVVIRSTPADLVGDARRLAHLLRSQLGVVISPQRQGSVWIESTFDPADEIALIALLGLDDARAFMSDARP